MTDNIFKFLDALDFADEFELDVAAYICDRDKAFDRVDHRWLIRLLCHYCGVILPLFCPHLLICCKSSKEAVLSSSRFKIIADTSLRRHMH
jgi:hypothetical protein